VDVDVSLDYGLTLLAALLIGTGFVLQQNAAQGEPDSRFLSLRLIADLLRQPRWLVGIGCMVGGQVLAAWSIGNLSLAFVEPLLTTNLVFALVLAVPIAKATLKFWEIFGAVVLCTGVALLSAARSAQPIGLSFGSIDHWWTAAVIAGIAFACVHTGRRHPGRLRAMLTGTAAGLVFGIQDALTRQTLEILSSNGVGAMFTTWAPYALVGAGATGIWLMQSAFSAGPLTWSLPAIAAGEPVVGILLGVLVFGDRVQVSPGELALQAGGIVALIAGVILVGRAPALSQLRGWTPPSLPNRLEQITGSLPSLPSLPTLAGRHPEDGAADHDQVPNLDGDARPRGDGHNSGDGHANGDGHQVGDGHDADDGLPAAQESLNGHRPPDLTRAKDSAPADEPADSPNSLAPISPPRKSSPGRYTEFGSGKLRQVGRDFDHKSVYLCGEAPFRPRSDSAVGSSGAPGPSRCGTPPCGSLTGRAAQARSLRRSRH
jgi:drug/metabolite transporter (DMT)-like permease